MGNSGSNTARAVRLVVALVVVTCFIVGGVVTGAYLAVRHIVTSSAVGYAKALGVTIEPTEVRFGLTFVQLLDTKFVVAAIPGVAGTARRIDVDLEGIRPKAMLAMGVTIVAEGDPLALKESALKYWEELRQKSNSSAGTELPKVEWQHLDVHLKTGNAFLPTVSLAELSVASNVGATHDETTIRTAKTTAGAAELGPLEVAIRNQDGTFELGWGPTLLESSWRVAYRELDRADQVRFSFQPHPAKDLLEHVGTTAIPESLATAKVAGHFEAIRDRASGKTKGTLTINLSEFTPPYPPELKGYRFAKTTTLRAQIELDPLLLAAELRGIELRTGDLALIGHGRIDRELFSLRLRAELGTTLDCVTLAKGYATETVGGALGNWGASNAPLAIRGGVSVRVQIDADSRRLDDAKVVKRLGIGCGLRPMSLVDLMNLGLPPIPDPKTVERLIQQIPPDAVLSNLPAFPKLLPSIDELLNSETSMGGKPAPKKTAPSRVAPKRKVIPSTAHSATQ